MSRHCALRGFRDQCASKRLVFAEPCLRMRRKDHQLTKESDCTTSTHLQAPISALLSFCRSHIMSTTVLDFAAVDCYSDAYRVVYQCGLGVVFGSLLQATYRIGQNQSSSYAYPFSHPERAVSPISRTLRECKIMLCLICRRD